MKKIRDWFGTHDATIAYWVVLLVTSVAAVDAWNNEKRFSLAFSLSMICVALVAIGLSYETKRQAVAQHRTERTIELALDRIGELEGRLKLTESPSDQGSAWPWGAHHTEALGHLEAAARRFWKLYDPADADTAPTNKQVSEWLQKERGLSQKMADAIASILRADGLPTGPRK